MCHRCDHLKKKREKERKRKEKERKEITSHSSRGWKFQDQGTSIPTAAQQVKDLTQSPLEDLGSIPADLAQWVKDLVLLQAVV